VVTTLTPRRTVERVPYVTSPGGRVTHLVCDLGVFGKGTDGRFELAAIVDGVDVDEVAALVGWDDLAIRDELAVLPAPSAEEVAVLRRWDPQGYFLRA
jgi:acyl CoA:acetate/3-ketoacid CoA transferase beta subunit